MQEQDKQKNPTLRKLDKSKGEYCYVERKYSIDKNFNFTGTDKIESYNDVAFIFKNLQKASIENVFALHVLPNGKPLVQHISMGTFTSSVVTLEAIKDTVSRFNSQEVYFLHNHPSGNVKPSEADYTIYKKIKKSFGKIAKEGIIIDTISGAYSVFSDEIKKEDIINTPEGKKRKINILKFDTQVFSKDIKYYTITSSEDAARLVSAQRLNTGNNLSLLILNRSNTITANIHLEYSDVNKNKLSEDIILYATRFGGCSAIIYGRSNEFSKETSFRNKMDGLIQEIKYKSDFSLLDFINVKSMPEIDLFKTKGMQFDSAASLGLI